MGSDCMGQLGLADSISSTSKPIEHPFFKDMEILKIGAGKLHTLVLCKDNKVYSFGVNDDCALGRDSETKNENVNAFCGNDNNNNGENLDAFSFNNLPSTQGIPVEIKFENKKINEEIVDVCAGASFSALLTAKGNVYACGTFKSTSGVFGFDKTSKFQKYFKKIDNLKAISKIFAGHNHLILIDKFENIWTFGANEAGQLGRRHRERHVERCLDASQISTKKRADISNNFKKAAGGGCYSLAVNGENSCYGWGGNFNGQLGDGTILGSENRRKVLIEDKIEDVACGQSHSLFLMKNKELFGCGDNTLSQLGIDNKGVKMVTKPVLITDGVDKVQAGCDFTIILKNNTLFGFGSNMNGELGFDEIEFDEIFKPTEIDFKFKKIIDFRCGTDFTLILTE